MSPSSDASRPSSDDSEPPTGAPAPGGWLEERVAPLARRIGEAPAVRGLQEALPISFAGLLVALAGLAIFVEPGTVVERLRASVLPGFAAMALVLVVVLAVRLAVRLAYPVVPLLVASLVAFGFAIPRETFRSHANLGKLLGTSGLFTAIVCCLLVAGAIGLARRRLNGPVAILAGALAADALAGALWAVHFSIGDALTALLLPLGTLGDSFLALFLICAIEGVLWVLGIHGPALLAAIVLPVYLHLQFVNSEAALHHVALPHLVVVSTFLFVFPGGCGATFSLVILLLRSPVPRLRKFAYAMLLPSAINTNEPVILGLPIVYNPILGIPFIIAPLALCCTTWLAFSLEWVRPPAYWVISAIPVFANVFLATFDWRAIVLFTFNLIVAGAIYYPFVRIYERSEANR